MARTKNICRRKPPNEVNLSQATFPSITVDAIVDTPSTPSTSSNPSYEVKQLLGHVMVKDSIFCFVDYVEEV